MELIVSDEQFKQNGRNQMIKNRTKKNIKKQQQLKKISIGIVIGLIVAYFVGLIIVSDLKASKEARDNCLKNGYSYAYCLKNS